MRKFLLALPILACLFLGKAHAINNYNVTPGGSGSTCSSGSPGSIASCDASGSVTLGTIGTCVSTDGKTFEAGVGACIHAAPGTYNGPFNLSKAGSVGNRLMWVCDIQWTCILNNSDMSINANDVTIGGFTFTSPATGNHFGLQTTTFNRIHVLGNFFHDFDLNGCAQFGIINFGGNPTQTYDNWLIGNIVRAISSYSAGPNQCITAHGIYTHGGRTIIQNNIFSASTGPAIELAPTAGTTPGDVVTNNTIFGNGGAININEQIGGGVVYDFATIENNLIVLNGTDLPAAQASNGGIGYLHVTGTHNRVSNNMIYGNQWGGGVKADLSHHFTVCGTQATGASPVVGNNITGGDPSEGVGCPADNSQTDSPSSLAAALATTFTAFQNDTPTARSTNYNYLNYQLNTPSKAVGTGSTTCAGAPAISPCVPTTDILGHARSNPPSIGAFDFATSGTAVSQVLPASLTFSSTQVGNTSPILFVTLKNTGTASLTVTPAETITGTNAGDFQFAGTIGVNPPCTINLVLAPGNSCDDSIKFVPSSTGTRTAQINFFTTASNSPQVATFSGVGTSPTSPAITVSSSSIPFAPQSLNTVSGGIPFTITNSGTAVLSLTSITEADTTNSFAFSTDCGSTLGIGAFCTVIPKFQPSTLTSPKSGTITIVSNASTSPTVVSLSGTVVQSGITTTVPSLNFSDTPVGATTVAQTFNIVNTGSGQAQLTISATGDYAQTNTCSNGFSDSFSTGTLNSSLWVMDTGAAPGTIPGVNTGTFSTGNVDMSQNVLAMKVTQTGGSPVISVGAEVRSIASYGYGTYIWSLRSASTSTTPGGAGSNSSGQISSGFTFINNSQTELDVPEIEGQFPTLAEFTTWAGLLASQETSATVTTPFSTFHQYKVVWAPGSATYFIDNVLKATHNTAVPATPAGILFNIWGTNSGSFGGPANVGVTRWMYVNNFSFVPNSPTIPAGGSCTVSVTFSPTASGARAGNIAITVPDGGPNKNVPLTGNGTIPSNGVRGTGGFTVSGGVKVLN